MASTEHQQEDVRSGIRPCIRVELRWCLGAARVRLLGRNFGLNADDDQDGTAPRVVFLDENGVRTEATIVSAVDPLTGLNRAFHNHLRSWQSCLRGQV